MVNDWVMLLVAGALVIGKCGWNKAKCSTLDIFDFILTEFVFRFSSPGFIDGSF